MLSGEPRLAEMRRASGTQDALQTGAFKFSSQGMLPIATAIRCTKHGNKASSSEYLILVTSILFCTATLTASTCESSGLQNVGHSDASLRRSCRRFS